MHNGHNNGVDAHDLTLLIEFHGNLGLAVGTQQIIAFHTLGQPVGKGAGQRHRQWHQLRRLSASAAKHHALVACAANLIVGAHSDIGRLGMDLAQHLDGIGAEAGICMGIADGSDDLTGDSLVVHLSGGGDLTADHAKISGDHDLAGHTGVRILRQASIQDGIGDGICHLVGVAAGNTFRGK